VFDTDLSQFYNSGEERVVYTKEMENNSHNLVETGFFASAGRPKTLKAIQRVKGKMSADELKSLKDKVSIIFAPAPGIVGQVFPCRGSTATSGQAGNQQLILVYLSPRIEHLSQKRIESIVAHEFAHALLHAPGALEGWFIEQQADQKVRSWGFKVAYPDNQEKRGTK